MRIINEEELKISKKEIEKIFENNFRITMPEPMTKEEAEVVAKNIMTQLKNLRNERTS